MENTSNLLNEVEVNKINSTVDTVKTQTFVLENILDLDTLNAFNPETNCVAVTLNGINFDINVEEDLKQFRTYGYCSNFEPNGYSMTAVALKKLAEMIEATKNIATIGNLTFPLC